MVIAKSGWKRGPDSFDGKGSNAAEVLGCEPSIVPEGPPVTHGTAAGNAGSNPVPEDFQEVCPVCFNWWGQQCPACKV